MNFASFSLQGTTDNGNYLCAGKAVSFMREIGGVQACNEWAGQLLDWAADMLAAALGTQRLPVPKSMEAPYMRSIGENHHSLLRPLSLLGRQVVVILILEQTWKHLVSKSSRGAAAAPGGKEKEPAAHMRIRSRRGTSNCLSIWGRGWKGPNPAQFRPWRRPFSACARAPFPRRSSL